MTEKRFTVKDDVGMLDVACANIFDNGEFIGTVPLFDAEKFVELLNELHEENEFLKSNYKELVQFVKSKGYTLKDFISFIGQFQSVGVNKED